MNTLLVKNDVESLLGGEARDRSPSAVCFASAFLLPLKLSLSSLLNTHCGQLRGGSFYFGLLLQSWSLCFMCLHLM